MSDRGLAAPSTKDVALIAESLNMRLTDEDLNFFTSSVERALDAYRRLEALPEPQPAVEFARDSGYRPSEGENKLNAWYWRCSVKGASSGKLQGKAVALKDNICLAGIPMMNGSQILEGFVPEIDASVATRVLRAGGEIVGKAVCESFCLSGASNTADTGPVQNPTAPGYSAGGSSSGCAALVANCDCDLAVGGDQGGSIRIPSSMCGICGLKPTFGLVPYTGIFPIEMTVDHAGPMGRTVEDVALLLDVIAGFDGLDPRQNPSQRGEDYSNALTGDISDIRVTFVEEAFAWPESSSQDKDVFAFLRLVAESLTRRCQAVAAQSIPLHRDGIHLSTAIQAEGFVNQVLESGGFGSGWKGYYPTDLVVFLRSALSQGWAFSDTTKLLVLLGSYMKRNYGGSYYAKAQNQVRALSEAYDSVLRESDILVLPTCAPRALPLKVRPQASPSEKIEAGFFHHWNTCPFNLTGHPAISIPCCVADGIPIGLMLVGRCGEDRTVLRLADALYRDGDWRDRVM